MCRKKDIKENLAGNGDVITFWDFSCYFALAEIFTLLDELQNHDGIWLEAVRNKKII